MTDTKSESYKFTYLGHANNWHQVPAELMKCGDLGHEVQATNNERGADGEVRCERCRFWYTYDSSD